ncbi:cytochrome P450 4C1-like [Tenebrio molitor]|uniref:cytochrome P450 4C1-like n=1 Tax=Tenebrio molitor TaxID=7067 RepID=UPI0036248D56
MIVAGTETSTYASCFTILILAIYPEVQKNVQSELDSLFGESHRDPTMEDVKNMEYLERVIKESLRFFPPIPFVMRKVDETIEIDSQVFPAGSNVIIPMMKIHMRPDPCSFDPDRFLPEEVEKSHRCAYMPFSHGPRNCPGWKIGITGMKITLSSLLRIYTVKPVFYKTVKEIELDYAALMMPKDECQVLLKKRKK